MRHEREAHARVAQCIAHGNALEHIATESTPGKQFIVVARKHTGIVVHFLESQVVGCQEIDNLLSA